MTQGNTEEKAAMVEETQIEQESPLDSLLRKVDLNAPLEIKDHAGNLVEVPRDKFIEYYMPEGATQSESFHCMQAVRATGLSLFAPGECYFFKTGTGPVRLFTGYMAYLRKAYAAGLEHIEQPVIDFGDAPGNYPVSATITIKIKGRDDMTWTTWFAEVAGMSRDELNSRWKKAPIQMLIKCAIVNILRLSGLVDFSSTYTIDEMPDPVVTGYRTLTEDQLDRWKDAPQKMLDKQELEAQIGEVNAANHQIDTREAQKRYFGSLKKAGITFKSDEERRAWQKEMVGKEHVSDFATEDFQEMAEVIAELKLGNETMAEKSAAMDRAEKQKAKAQQGDQEDSSKTKDDLMWHPDELKADEGSAGTASHAFYSEADKRFSSPEERDRWITTVVSPKPIGEWSPKEWGIASKALLELPLLDREDPPKTKGGTLVDAAVKDAVDQGVQETVERNDAIAEMDSLAAQLGWGRDELRTFVNNNFPTEWQWDQLQTSDANMISGRLSIKIDEQAADEAPEQPDTREEPEKPQDAPKESPQQGEDERKRQELKAKFIDLAAERFPDAGERMLWIKQNVGPPDKLERWDPKLFENGIELLSEDADDAKMSKETRDTLRDALLKFPGEKYGKMRNMKFRKFANEAIEGTMRTVADLTEKQGKAIIWKLAAEKAAIDEEVERVRMNLLEEGDEPLVAQAAAEEIVSMEEPQEQEQKDGADWLDEELEKAKETGEWEKRREGLDTGGATGIYEVVVRPQECFDKHGK